MGRITRRDILAVLPIALVSGLLGTAPLLENAHGLSLDVLTALRWELFGARRDPAAASPAVVIAIDEESLSNAAVQRLADAHLDARDRPRPHRRPRWRRQGVGFDIIFPSSIEQSEIPFGDELGRQPHARLRPRLPASAGAGAAGGKLVLGEIQQRDFSDAPVAGTADRRPPAAEHPRAERLCRSRRGGSPPAAVVRGRRRPRSVDGGRAGGARQQRSAGIRRRTAP